MTKKQKSKKVADNYIKAVIASAILATGFTAGKMAPEIATTLPDEPIYQELFVDNEMEEKYVSCKKSLGKARLERDALHLQMYGPEIGTVTRILDGDTIDVDGMTVRILGINTPEKGRGKRIAEPFSKEALEYTTKVLLGKKVKMESGPENIERFCRLLRIVWYEDGKGGWKLFETEILEKGLAKKMLYNKHIPYYNEMVEAEAKAQKKRLGIWSYSDELGCGDEMVPIEAYRLNSKKEDYSLIWADMDHDAICQIYPEPGVRTPLSESYCEGDWCHGVDPDGQEWDMYLVK